MKKFIAASIAGIIVGIIAWSFIIVGAGALILSDSGTVKMGTDRIPSFIAYDTEARRTYTKNEIANGISTHTSTYATGIRAEEYMQWLVDTDNWIIVDFGRRIAKTSDRDEYILALNATDNIDGTITITIRKGRGTLEIYD